MMKKQSPDENESQLHLSLHRYDNIDQGLYNSEAVHSEKDKYFAQISKYDDYIDFTAQLELQQIQDKQNEELKNNPYFL